VIGLVLKSTLLLLLIGVAAYLLRRQSASLVHRVWMAGLVAALAMPVVSAMAPEWSSALPFSLGLDLEASDAIANLLRTLWLAGAVVGLGLMLAGAARLGWLVLHSEPLVDARWNAIVADLGRRLNLRRPVHLLSSPKVSFLGTWGIWRPRVLVPRSARSWSDRRVRAVLAHELAHAARGDWPVQVLSEAARAIYWFNPLFWILASRLRQESEHAADNMVLGLGMGQADYARELLEISQQLGAHARQGPILAMAQPSFLERRLVAILNPKLKRVAAAPWATLVIMLLAIGLSVPLATMRDGSAGIGRGSAGASTQGSAGSAAVGSAVGGPAASAPAVAGASCPVTPILSEAPPDSDLAAAFGNGPWHVNEDRSIWVWAQPYVAEQHVSAIWIRPEGTRLELTGERLDGSAPPIEASFNCCFPNTFKTGGLRFPTPGCWRVDATAGDRRLSFVTEVGAEP
jgi:beta-lactamase regulating signal transducer with metallopeptidase domain